MVVAYLLRKVRYERDDEKEYMVKAAMLVKFYQHTKWPALPKDTDEKTINICVVGENPFSSKARSVFASACTPERQFNFLKGQAYKKQFCHIVFFGNISQDKMEKILNDLTKKPFIHNPFQLKSNILRTGIDVLKSTTAIFLKNNARQTKRLTYVNGRTSLTSRLVKSNRCQRTNVLILIQILKPNQTEIPTPIKSSRFPTLS